MFTTTSTTSAINPIDNIRSRSNVIKDNKTDYYLDDLIQPNNNNEHNTQLVCMNVWGGCGSGGGSR
jgi:hypothetical protein